MPHHELHNAQETGDCLVTVRYVGGNHDGELLSASQNQITMGSDPEAIWTFDRPDIESLHCVLLQSEKGTMIESREGTIKVNEQFVSQEELCQGDTIDIAGVRLQVEQVQCERNEPAENSDRPIDHSNDGHQQPVRQLLQLLRNAENTLEQQKKRMLEPTNKDHGAQSTRRSSNDSNWMELIGELDLDEIDPSVLEQSLREERVI